MKKLLSTTVLFCLAISSSIAQKVFPFSTTPLQYINWYNYATSYAGDDKKTYPTILTAVPYNGVYEYFDNNNSPTSLAIQANVNRYFSQFSKAIQQNSRSYTTFDSAEVYFLAPNIFRTNAVQYEYRVLLNAQTIVKPWTSITDFADSSVVINALKKGMAYLGGYKAVWDNFLSLELREKNSQNILSVSIVHWQHVKPALLNIYPATELNAFLDRLKKPYIQQITEKELKKWSLQYKPHEIDSASMLPKQLMLSAENDNIIFYLRGDVYEKQALEYRLVKNNKELIPWQSNDFDNNLIWLKDLKYGDYSIEMRYRSQRHNTTAYLFKIKPAWYQQALTKIIAGALLGLLLMLIARLWRQKIKTKQEALKNEKLSLELKALRSQLNPHFVFNALSSLQALINKNDTAKANHYLSVFSDLLRQSLINKDAELVPLGVERQMLDSYIKIEQLRFGFQYQLIAAPALLDIEIPAMLVQPLVENAIKHGVSSKSEQGVLKVLFSTKQKDFIIHIVDNGNGFDTGTSKAGIGLKLVGDRINLLNNTFKYGQHINWTINSVAHQGTTVHLTFTNWL